MLRLLFSRKLVLRRDWSCHNSEWVRERKRARDFSVSTLWQPVQILPSIANRATLSRFLISQSIFDIQVYILCIYISIDLRAHSVAYRTKKHRKTKQNQCRRYHSYHAIKLNSFIASLKKYELVCTPSTLLFLFRSMYCIFQHNTPQISLQFCALRFE